MRVLLFSARPYDRREFTAANARIGHDLSFVEARLGAETLSLAAGYEAVCTFVNDTLDASVLRRLADGGTRLIALRCAGFNQVDVRAAAGLGLTVVRVPAYAPHAVAEHAAGLVLTLNRKFHRAYNRVRDDNFLIDGLEGFDLYGKTVGVVGAGRIGRVFVRIMLGFGFGCQVLVHDPQFCAGDACIEGASLATLPELFAAADIVSLHCPLTPETHHLIGAQALARMKPGAMLINTSRGGLLDTAAVIGALKSGHLGALGLDVYEQEGDLFYEDLSSSVVTDDVFQRLLTFPNVVVTAHQAFFTREALAAIADTTLANIAAFGAGRPIPNRVLPDLLREASVSHEGTGCAPGAAGDGVPPLGCATDGK
ncbi:2-hydroxyacid dehydrogenase [Pseudomonas aeruginosa]|uniref:2-hydroxyacid dehydrogenase n=1 Tax=Gammaproteobacteria TaxID=1236 RepID=UPI0009A2F853|nr:MULTISPECIES: 2-hydroxyacid dehydrogenase [Gammaproteobacteria]EIZ0539896.1 2-hydroxyacid dehydrogenase [Pseudomonas aeruginosa]EKV4127263.1 2-hydroxyacid dehydrogenase [Pseudomonas aeruginosa]EKW0411141.1 2-hydroxyacid dehydrogenase [Pseudomonas aeruginosa]EKW1417709.1 2-hydroxyacid dehydrogenase [Pseudomonas aeruginosa]EKW1532595.1 2-hydroxyacid dehydrogenase [Pseudomonas aeruginosa]